MLPWSTHRYLRRLPNCTLGSGHRYGDVVHVPTLPFGSGRRRASGSPSAFVRDIDERTLAWMAGTSHGPARPLLGGVARAADLLLPFAAVTLRLVVEGPEERRAVMRGWGAVAATALVQGAVLKPVIGRGRPDPKRLPPTQRRRASPTSSSFPSGHSGAGTAFVTAVGLGVPRARRSLAILVFVVAYAQVYTGRHYLSDVVIGGTTGLAVGALVDRSLNRQVRTS